MKGTSASKWVTVRLGEILTLEYGKSFPAQKRKDGPYAVYGSNGIIARADQYLLEEKTIIVGRKGSAGEINFAEPKSWPIDTTYYVAIKDGRVYSLDFVYYLLKWLDPRRFVDTTTKPGLNRDRVYEQDVPLPPLPVQERIVHILQKAEEIRRKRQEALELADAILPASFLDMFGDPAVNEGEFERAPLGDLADVKSGVTKGRKIRGKETVEVPYLRVANVQDGFLDLSEVKTIEVLPEDVDRYRLEDGDILIIEGCGNPRYLGRGCLWRGEIEGCIHQNHVFRIRTNRKLLLPEFLASLLRTQYANRYFVSCAKNSSGLYNINSTQVKAFQVPVPPIRLQGKFVSAVEQWVQVSERLAGAWKASETLFRIMLDQAFTGKLTAEWESANEGWIASQAELQGRWSRLILLALVQESIARAGRKSAVPITALMQYSFLFQMEANVRRPIYHFVPFEHGPFAKDLYADLQKLEEEGLITVDPDPDIDKTLVTVTDHAKVDTALLDLSDEEKEDVAAVLATYGDLDHPALIRIVYEKYPAYAGKSQVGKRGR